LMVGGGLFLAGGAATNRTYATHETYGIGGLDSLTANRQLLTLYSRSNR
jgi:hypothetical protein